MKNFLTPIVKNPVASKALGTVGKFYVDHKTAILTGGTIGFSMATTAVTLKNAGQIQTAIEEAKDMLSKCENQDEKNEVYAWTLREIAPLMAPIIIFQLATIGCALKAKKNTDEKDRKITELAGALSIAQTAVSQYQAFQKDAEEALGEKKYKKLQDDIYKDKEFDGRQFNRIPMEGAPGEVLIINKYSNAPMWDIPTRIEAAVDRYNTRLGNDGGYDSQTLSDLYELIGNKDLQPDGLSDKFGFIAGESTNVYFSDTHYIFPNGTKIPAFEMYLYPEPAFLSDERLY